MHPLEIKQLSIELPNGKSLANNLRFTIKPGEVLVLMGPSGSGKSSILAAITGTADPRLRISEDIWLGDTCISSLVPEKRKLGLMLQQDYLFPHMSVRDNLLFGLRGGSRAERSDIIAKALQDAGLANMESRDPGTLSGGQRARVSLVRTLLSKPCALLLDEPFSRLDAAMREQIRNFTWKSAAQLPVLLVTHDKSDVPEGARILDAGQSDVLSETL